MKHLTACLALQSNERDKALGINWASQQTIGLLWYYNHLHKIDVGKVAMASYLNQTIQQGAAEIKMLVARAEKVKNKHKILERVVAIQQEVEKAQEQLEAISNG